MQPKPKQKWHFAIGTTSRVPNSGGPYHYLIADFDEPFQISIQNEHLQLMLSVYDAIIQQTEHGWHLYTSCVLTFRQMLFTLKEIGADPAWRKIGTNRGYWFLADKRKINFPWKVEHMVLHYAKEKALDSQKARLSFRAKGHNKGSI